MTYPALMMVVATGLMLGIFTFVIPKLAKIFESMNKPMPPMTQVPDRSSATSSSTGGS